MVRVPPRDGAIHLTEAQARQIALRAVGLWDTAKPSLKAVIRHHGAIQLDTISVLARNHELIPYARLGAVGRGTVERHYWSETKPQHFEYWAHAACIIPIEDWPLYAFRRDAFKQRGKNWHNVSDKTIKNVLKHIEKEGPVHTGDVGGAKVSGYWWDWSDNKIALEQLLNTGAVAVTRREGFRRIYDLSERAIPAKYFSDAPAIESMTKLLVNALNLIGIGNKAELFDMPRFSSTDVNAKLAWTEFIKHPNTIEVQVEGWNGTYYASKKVIAALDDSLGQRAVMLSPFDPLLCHRDRMERMFGMMHRIEAYTPAAKRVYGYFAMPVLVGDELVARIDPTRESDKNSLTLVAKKVTFESAKPSAAHIQGVADALRECASWVKASSIRVDEVVPASAKKKLTALTN